MNSIGARYFSIEGAQRDYGVIIKGDQYYDPEGLEINYQATERLRTDLRSRDNADGSTKKAKTKKQ
jgi:hypothetical protein